uniref:Uncharacterized protein n=1 Tax=Arundo donax TaxID=35708 RepID=A0A0A9H1I7_ARUDO
MAISCSLSMAESIASAFFL